MRLAGPVVSIGLHVALFALVSSREAPETPRTPTQVTIRHLKSEPPPPIPVPPKPTPAPTATPNPDTIAPSAPRKQVAPAPAAPQLASTDAAAPGEGVLNLDTVLSNEGFSGGNALGSVRDAPVREAPRQEVRQPVAKEAPCASPPTKPQVVAKVPIAYPEAARARGIEGHVVLRAHVTASGQVASVDILRSAGAEIDGPAVAALKAWRFSPALSCGRPTASEYTVARRFELGG